MNKKLPQKQVSDLYRFTSSANPMPTVTTLSDSSGDPTTTCTTVMTTTHLLHK